MKFEGVLTVAFLFLARSTFAQNSDCRQSWMPPDAPAFCAWQTEPSLPEARTYHALTTFKNHIYVLGGFNFDPPSGKVTYYDSVVQSTIGADGRLGAWTVEPPFKDARSGAAAVTVGNCVFVAGGSSSSPTSLAYYDDIQFARIGGDGHLSPWTTVPNHFKTPRSNLALVAVVTSHGVFLNAIAGVTQIGQDTVHLDTVETAKVESDCSVGGWTVANYHIKGGRSTPEALFIRNNVVVIGGWGDLDLIDVYNDVQVAGGRADGSPAPWKTAQSHLPTGIYGHATVFAEAEKQLSPSLLMSLGGQPGAGAYANWISYAYVSAGATFPDAIGIWRIAPTGRMPSGLAGLAAAQSSARLYVIGGNDASGQYYSAVLSARFDFGQP
jgi:hypothetical protein